MNDVPAQRRRILAQMLRSESLASQEEVQERLRDLGVQVTQATVSRDLDQLGAIKVRREGKTVYALPGETKDRSEFGARLEAILREWVRSAEAVGNLVVLKTPPGSAHLVGVALDESAMPSIAGTICGDDTIFVAVRDNARPQDLASFLSGAGTPRD